MSNEIETILANKKERRARSSTAAANESEGRVILHCRRADVPFPALKESVYVITLFGQFKGKGNGGSEAPKLRNHFRAEIHEQRAHCVRGKRNRNLRLLEMFLVIYQ